ncbi:MAG: MBL fold metallo-hydrolase [Bacteroidetes bacterium]|nr:MAG: MBL fold metallo-hydrolase [Bacteroidota bacterium]
MVWEPSRNPLPSTLAKRKIFWGIRPKFPQKPPLMNLLTGTGTMKNCKLYLNIAGYCMAKGSHAVKGESPKDIPFKALFGLIQHPEKGWILFDTGYTRRFYNATRFFPNKMYALTTRVLVDEKDEIKSQIENAGIHCDDIRHVIISHFHADHIGGLKDFSNATFYCSQTAWDQVKQMSNFMAFSKGILKGLIPEDFESRLKFVEEAGSKIPDAVFGHAHDLFNDNSILVYNLPGHAAGQIGIALQTQTRKYFLIADACWDERAYLEMKLPHPIVRLVFHSWKEYVATVSKIQRYHELFPDVWIVPAHCSASTDKVIRSNIDLNVL